MSLVMQGCKHCGWQMGAGDILIIRPDDMLVCPECGKPIELEDRRVEEPNKDKASEAILKIRLLYDPACADTAYELGKHLMDIEDELKAKDKEIELITEDRDGILAIMESQRKIMREKDEKIETKNKKIWDLGCEIIAKDKEIADLKDENEELADLIVKWEAGYAELFKKITEIKESGAMA